MSNQSILNKPTSSVEVGVYYSEQVVELSYTTPFVNIYYTVDGSQPTNESTLYSKPIKIHLSLTIKAVAILKINDHNNAVRSMYSDTAIFNYRFESQHSIASKFLYFTYKSMPYRLFVPDNFDSKKTYPLILFLHGGGERGKDNEKQLMANDGAIIWAATENQSNNPGFVLAPQSRNTADGGFGITRDSTNKKIDLTQVFKVSKDLLLAHEILQHVKQKYNIDRNRLYCTGVSQGGFGTYNLNILYPNLFAAMVPIAAGGNPDKANILVDKPIWNFHAEDDLTIPVSFSRNIIEKIKKLAGNPLYTEYPANMSYNHSSWVPAYKNKDMIEWVFKQVKRTNSL